MNGKTIELTPELVNALHRVYEDLANLPKEELYHKIKTARIIAEVIDIDEDDFHIETGGYFLYSDSRHPNRL